MSTNAQRVKSAIITLTSATAFEVLSESVKYIIPFQGFEYITEKYDQNIQNCVISHVFAHEKTCLTFSVSNTYKIQLFVFQFKNTLNFVSLITVAV